MDAERAGEDATSLKDLWDETYRANVKHLIPAEMQG